MNDLFARTDLQKEWMTKLNQVEHLFKSHSVEVDTAARFPMENVEALVKMGYTHLTLPTNYGGDGVGTYEMVLLQELLGSFDGATALSIGWHLGVVGEIYARKKWSEATLDFFAKEVLNGALVNRIASEMQTGSPSRGGRPGTTAVRKGDAWVISGRKNYATMSPALTYFLTSAWIEETETIGFFLVHKDSKGLSIEETWDVVSMRGTSSHDLILDHVVVEDAMLVERSKGPREKQANGWLLHIPACYLGIAQAARDYAVAFSKEYAPNSTSGPICELPNVQTLIGEMDLALMNARHFLYSVAEAYDDSSRRPLLTNELGAAKHIATNTAIAVVDKAMRLVGAKSLQRENPLQRYYRDVRAGLHNPPMDDATIRSIALTAIQS